MLTRTFSGSDCDAQSRPDAALKTFSVVFARRDAQREMRTETIAAPDARAAQQIAMRLFADCIVLGVQKLAPRASEPYPDARFIHGRFEPAAP